MAPRMPTGKDSGGSDSRFFTTQKKGEMHELRLELHSTDRNTKVDAVKKVIASMTVGKDVSMLFTDVLNCVQTGNIELKKLVYLYLINYAKSQPELTLLAVNTFVKDTLQKLCTVEAPADCSEKENGFIAKNKGKSVDDVAKSLARLEGMKGKSMAPELKKWLMQRINILKQLRFINNGPKELKQEI